MMRYKKRCLHCFHGENKMRRQEEEGKAVFVQDSFCGGGDGKRR